MATRFELTSLSHPTISRGKGLLALLVALNSTWRQRRALSRLDSHMLRDIGVTPEAAKNEADRPFWDVPANWWH